MKRAKLAKILTCLLLMSSMIALNPIRANAEWKQDSNGWWNTEGDSYSMGWKEVDGKWYYFDKDGYMVHDTIIEGYKIGSDGAWIQTEQNSQSVQQTTSAQVTTSGEVTIKTEKSEYSIGTKEIKFSYTNNTNYIIKFPENYKIEKFEDNSWRELTLNEYFPEGINPWTLNPQKTWNETCNLDLLEDYNKLTPGKYRIVKEIWCQFATADKSTYYNSNNNSDIRKTLTAEFELK